MTAKKSNFFGLTFVLAKAEFKLRNEGTWLGIFWYLLAPILTFFLLLGIFTDRLGQEIPNYPLYLLLGIILFGYFQKICNESVKVIRKNAGIIKSLNFHKESLVSSIAIKVFFVHIFEVFILLVFLIFFKIPLGGMIFYVLILFFLTMFSLGCGLILASLGTYFFDLEHIWMFVSKLIWFATPIFYAIEGQTRLFYLNLFNPMYYFITIARDLIVYGRASELWIILSGVFYSLLFLLIGLLIFNKLQGKFAELI